MKHRIPLSLRLFLLSCITLTTPATAQTDTTPQNLDGALSTIVRQHALMTRATRSAAADSVSSRIRIGGRTVNLKAPLRLTISTREGSAATVAARLKQGGHTAQVITPALITATFPIEWIDSLTAMPEVLRLNYPRRFRPLLNKARPDGNVDKVHSGSSLSTPFTGRGVVVGIIDESFEFRHPAFLDKSGESRVKVLWDRSGYSSDPNGKNQDTQPTTTIPTGTDKVELGGGGHATHVTNIAAGSDTGNGLQGVAPGADIIMIPSSFDDKEIIEDVKYVRDYARQHGQPWVVNMSFGSQTGPHDGTTTYDQTLDRLLDGKGAFITAAMGNEGADGLHSSAALNPGETKYLLCDFDIDYDSASGDEETDGGILSVDLWSLSADGKKHFNVTPFVYSGGTIERYDDAFWKKHIDPTSVLDEISVNNNKEHHGIYFDMNTLAKEVDDYNLRVGLEITALSTNTSAETLHVWVDGNGTAAGVSNRTVKGHSKDMLKPDNDYIVGEGAASIPRAISVGAYVSNIPKQVKTVYPPSVLRKYKVGDRCDFSSSGPSLNERYPKPAILTPGSFINSAQNQLAKGFNADDEEQMITTSVGKGKNKAYYGLMEGTSQAAPFMAGTIALWLEANPNLSYDDMIDIIHKSSRKHTAMNGKDWTSQYGYGLVDAYAGLKLALEKGGTTGISRPSGSAAPVSIVDNPNAWRVLFNNPEREATISVLSIDGRQLATYRLGAVSQGHEEIIPVSHYAPGIYLLKISTPGAQLSKRLVVTTR